MVAIVSGNSLGLDLTSLRTLGPQDFTGSAAHGRNGQGVYVNASNGNLVVQGLEANVATAGADVQGLRTYNSQGLLDDDSGVGGDNWSNGYFLQPLRLVGTYGEAGSEIHLTGRDGAVAKFAWKEEYGFYLTTEGDGPHDNIALNAEGTLYTWRDGATGAHRRYEADGLHRLVSTGDPSGNVLTYSYTGARLDKIVDAAGNGTRYDYDAGTGLLKGLWTVEGGADKAQRVFYEYDASNRLAKVTVDLSPEQAGIADGDVYWTEYTYHGEEQDYRLATIRQKDGTSLSFAYEDNGSGRIASVTDALGGVTEFRYNGATTTVEDALGRITTYEKDAQGQLKSITAPTSGGVTASRSFTYDGDGNVTSVVDGEGRTTTYSHDVWGRVTLETDGAGKRIEREYDDRHQLTVERVLQQADADGTGPIVEVVAVTRQVWDVEVRGLLRFVVSAEGRVSEHRYDAARQRETTIVYLADRYTTGTAALSESTMEAWAAQRAPAARQRIDMTYLRGELATRTTYASVDAAGNGVVGTESTERFVYDDAGRLLQSVTATGHATTYTYDGLGRVETVTNALNQTSVTEYQDAGGKIVHTLAHGLVRTETYDLAGRLVTSVASGGGDENLGTTRNYYDANGRLRMTQDPTGRRQWILYTAAGQKAAEVDANGTMKEWGYDAGGRVTWMREYATAIDMTRLPVPAGITVADQVAGDLRPATTNEDYRAWYAYDGAGRLVRSAETVGTSADVAVTERRYDAAGRLEREIRYAKAEPLTASDITLPDATEQDRVTRYFYDRDGLLRGTLDGEGFLTELRYDNRGQLEQRIAYANPTPLANRNAQALAGALPTADAAKDIRTYYFHDGHGRRIGELDGERYLTEHQYDSNGRLLKTLRYLQAVTGPITTLDAARPLAGEAKTQASYLYDVLGRVTTEINAEDTWTRYRYDVAGNLTSTTRAYNTDEARTSATRYDLFGRVTEELAPLDYARIRSTMSDAEKDAIWAQYATKHTYDAAGRHIRTNDALGRKTLYFYDADGALVYTVDPLGRIKEKVYDVRGRLVEEVERLGTISTTGLYGGSVPQALLDRMAAADQADDFSTKYAYTRDGRVTTVTSPTGNLTTTVFNAFGESLSRTQGMGNTGPDRVETYAYDRRGLLVKTVRDPGTLRVEESLVHDAFGRVVSTTDPVGAVRTQAYDRLGRVVETVDATGGTRRTTYDAFNRALTQTDALGRITTFTYDPVTRTVSMRTPEGIVTQTVSTRHGEVARRIDGLARETRYVYNRNGQLERTEAPLATDSTTYDVAGRVATTTDPNGTVVAYTYDPVDRVMSRTVDPGGLDLVTTYAYDGRNVRVTDPAGTVTLTRYDKKGRVATQVVDEGGLNLTTTFTYNPADQTLTVTAPGGTVTSYAYDALGRRTSETVDPGGLDLVRSWTYDAAGHVRTATNALGQVTHYTYDAEGRLAYTQDPLRAVTRNIYDANGNLVSRIQFATALPAATAVQDVPPSAQDRQTWWAYDKDGRMVFEVDALLGITEQEYDAGGNVVRRTAYATPIAQMPVPGLTSTVPQIESRIQPVASQDRSILYAYDAAGRQVRSTDAAGAVTSTVYDAAGNVLKRTQHATLNSTTADGDDRSIRFAYDRAGRLIYTIDAIGALQETKYDDAGRIVERTRFARVPPLGTGNYDVKTIQGLLVTNPADQKEKFEYDAAGRQVRAIDALGFSETYAYDKAGNRTSFTNKKGDTWTYVYDAMGRMTEEKSPLVALAWQATEGSVSVSVADGRVVTRMAYDALGQLVSRTEAAGRPEERTTTYVYDAAGRQVKVNQGWAPVYDAASDSLATSGVVGPAEKSAKLETVTFYDTLGNAVANVDATGAPSQKAYDALGRVAYEVDALGYITGYQRNAFGEVRVLTRYGHNTNLEVRTVTKASEAVTLAAIEARLEDPVVDHTYDRTLTTAYDRAGRATQVLERSAQIFDPTATGADQWTTARKTTATVYNAFGEAVESRSLRNAATSDWSVTTRFYDRNGREKATVDARGYLTARSYDAFGNLVASTEYANTVVSGWSKEGYTRGADSVSDRRTEYEYDRGNRKVLERRVDVEYSTASNGTSERGNLETAYAYDAVGNQTVVTDARGYKTHTYYDAIGRVSAVVQPQMAALTPAGGSELQSVRPVTTYLRDAHGNVLREMRRANGATLVSEAGFTEGAASSSDRYVRTRYDRLGRAVQVNDTRAFDQFFSYDAAGRVAKMWREVGDGRITYEVNIYDKLGQLLDVRRPRTTMEVQGGITARWAAAPWVNDGVTYPSDGPALEVGWTGLEGTRVRVEVTYTTVEYSITTPGSGSEEPTTTPYPAKTLTVTQERTAAQAPGGMTVAFQDPVAKIDYIRVRELIGTNWVVRWEGSYNQAQGSGVTEVDQSVVGQTFTSTRYNGFGEVVLRGTNGDLAEYFDYDAAGRLWRTNSGDGVDKVYLYDAQGNRTSEIRSAGIARGNVDLQLVASAADAHGNSTLRRTDFVYDELGRLVQKTDAARLEVQGGLTVRQLGLTTEIQAVGGPPAEGSFYDPVAVGTDAKVKLTWDNLTGLGSGDVKVRVAYKVLVSAEVGATQSKVYDSAVFESHEGAQGLILSWPTQYPLDSVTEVTVWKKNSNGNWTEVFRQAPGASTSLVDLDAASNRWAPEYLEYRVAGSTAAWTRAALTDFGDRAAWFGGRTLAAGTYEYRIGVEPQGQDAREVGTGTLTVAANGTMTRQATDNNGDIWQRPVVKQTLDRWGNVVVLTDPRSEDWKTVYGYNASNQMILQRLPRADGVQASTNPATQIYYDAMGRQVAVRDALGNVNGSIYNANGHLVREIRADGGIVDHRYNVFGEKVETTDARDKVQVFTYDKGGNLVKVDKGSASVFEVDTNQELLDNGPRNIVESWTYDALGRRTSHTNGEGEKTSYRYDLLGNLIEWTQPMGQKSYAAYDRQGRKIAEVDANGYEATWQYDYFGQLLAHTDVGAATYHYSYDNARQLLTQTNTRGQDLSYKYDAVGQVTEIRDQQKNQPLKITTYAYDLGGRRLIEKTTSGGLYAIYQDNRLAYDAQGRLRDVSDNRVRMQFTHDANGNRLSVRTTLRYAGMTGEVASDITRYFKYDAMNRQVVVDADNAAGDAGADLHRITYDKNGNRISDTYTGYAVTKDASGNWTVYDDKVEIRETYAYDALNRLLTVNRNEQVIDRRNYDAADRVVKSGAVLSSGYREKLERLVTAGHVAQPTISLNRYDANGRLLHQTVKGPNDAALQEISWDPNEAPREVPAGTASAFRAEGYDHAGNVKGYTVFTHQGSTTNRYSTTLERYEGYVGTESTVRSSDGDVGVNAQVYDANGHLVKVDDNHLTGYGRVFINDAEGRALYVRRDDKEERQFIVNGEVLGRYGIGPHDLRPVDGAGYPNFTNIADFNFSFAPVSPTYPAPSPGAYIVKVGDTLQTVAKGAYGDTALWYRIAEANGLSSNDDVRVGQVLNIPNRVGTIHNNDGTFKPYDPSKITGDVSPHLPMPGAEGCGAAGQVLMVVVAVVVTIYTAGALSGMASASVSTMSAGMNVMANGAAALASTSAGASLGFSGTMAFSAAMGSIASQAVGVATNTIQKFDVKAVGLAAIGGYVGAQFQGLNAFPKTEVVANAVVRAAAGNVLTQGVATAVGLQKKFDWRSVAAASMGAGVAQAVSPAIQSAVSDPFIARLATGLVAGSVAAVARAGKVIVEQVAVDAFGNALGQGLAENMSGLPTAQPAQGTVPGQLGSGSYGMGDVDECLFMRFAGLRPTLAAQPEVPGISSDFRLSEREYRMESEKSVAGSAYRARPGDGISRIVGSSSPQAIGNFMRANGMTTGYVEAGRNYFRPDSETAYGDSAALGQFALNQSNERIAAQRPAAALARNTLVTDDITLGDLDVLNAAFARKDTTAAFVRNFVGPLQPPRSFGEIKSASETGFLGDFAGAVIGEPLALLRKFAGGLPVNPITNRLENFDGADRILLTTLGVVPLPSAKMAQGARVTTLAIQKRLAEVASTERDALLRDPMLLGQYLRQGEIDRIAQEPWIMRLFFGSALQRRIQDVKSEDALLSALKSTRSNAPQDFIGPGGFGYDLTGSSKTSILIHANRPGIDAVVTYDSIPSNFGRQWLKAYVDDSH